MNRRRKLLLFGGAIDPLKQLLKDLYGNGEQGAFYVPKPRVLGQQVLFQDAAGTIPVTEIGDPVGKMIDISGATFYNATQEVSTKRPSYVGNENNLLEFDGTDDFLDTGAERMGNTGLFADSNEEFFVAIAFKIEQGKQGTLFARAAAAGASRTLQIFFQRSINTRFTPSISVRGAGGAEGNDTNWQLDDGKVHVIWLNWDKSTFTAGYDNVAERTLNVGTANEISGQRIIIGARTNGEGFHLEGGMGPVVIRDKSTSPELRERVVNELLKVTI